ncbi:MAG: vWA domain-containing protein, partial [Pseudomonadota bacterium]
MADRAHCRLLAPHRNCRQGAMKPSTAAAITVAASLGLASLLLLTPTQAQDRDRASLAVVFDGSGSMWGKIEGGGGAKFQNARDALAATLASGGIAPPRTAVFGFGARRRGSCGTSETLSDFKDSDTPEAALAALQRINPRGRGPIVTAMEAAGAALKAETAPRHMLVIHDDNDNCRQDPCATARALKSDMPDLAIHAITLRDAAAPKIFACFAEITGGTVAQTLDQTAITRATENLLRQISTAPIRPPAGSARTPPPAADDPARVSAGTAPPTAEAGITEREGPSSIVFAANLAAAGPRYTGPIHWTIAPLAATDDAFAARTALTDTGSFRLEPGQYTVTAATPLISVTETVAVNKDRISVYVANLKSGAITFDAKLGDTNARVAGARLTVRKTSKDGQPAEGPPAIAARITPAPVPLPEGTYLVSARKDGVQETIRLDVVAGAAQVVDLRLPGAELDLSVASDTAGATPTLVVEEVVPAETPTWRDVVRLRARQGRVVVLPGTYRITATADTARISRRITVAPGQRAALPLSLRATQVTLTSRLPEIPDAATAQAVNYRITSLDTPDIAPRIVFDAAPTLALAPGRYEFESRAVDGGSIARRTVVIAPRQRQTIEIEHDVGRVALQMLGG